MISASSWRRWHYRDQKMSVLYKIYALDNRLCCQPWLFQLTFISKRHVTDVQLQWSMSIKSQRRCVTTSKQVYVMQMWLRLSLSIVNRSCKVNTVQAAWCEYLFSEFRPRFGFILKPHNGSHVIPYVLDAPSGGGGVNALKGIDSPDRIVSFRLGMDHTALEGGPGECLDRVRGTCL